MKQFILSNLLSILGGIVGGVGGYLYYLIVGCSTGSCPITSSPIISTLWGMAMGALIFSMFNKKNKKDENNNSRG
ncbi:MAG: hypothetical protein RR329_03580 [Mucinivorans sp.]